MSAAEVFESHFEKSAGCWVWKGLREPDMYGKMRVNGKMKRAHRVSWEIYRGEIPNGMCVCHICDNPPCVNPDHLFLGTQKDNCVDRSRKGRSGNIVGELHGRALLTNTEVQILRHLMDCGVSPTRLASLYRLGRWNLYLIKSRKNWGKVPDLRVP